MMETARDLNMETDEMQLVVSALRGVGKRIVEVAQTHKPLFAGELFLTGKEVCERLYISPRTLQDYRDRKIIPYTQFAGKILYKASDLERMLEENYYFINGHRSVLFIKKSVLLKNSTLLLLLPLYGCVIFSSLIQFWIQRYGKSSILAILINRYF